MHKYTETFYTNVEYYILLTFQTKKLMKKNTTRKSNTASFIMCNINLYNTTNQSGQRTLYSVISNNFFF